MRVVTVRTETFPIAGSFRISRGAKTEAHVVTCSISEDGFTGWGECVPYGRYGETIESVVRQIEATIPAVQAGLDRTRLLSALEPGAARNAIDCALWDLEAKRSGLSVAGRIAVPAPTEIETAYTLSLSDPEAMYAQAVQNAWRPVLKVKVGLEGDEARMRAIVRGAPDSRVILDANEGWGIDVLQRHLDVASELGIALIEQPVRAGDDEILRRVDRRVRICADESVHTAADLEKLVGLYDAVNIKLDKAGGLTAAIELRNRARESGFAIMVGCMVGSSLSMAPAVLLAQDAEFVDLDGPLLLARDREPALTYEGALVYPPSRDLWG